MGYQQDLLIPSFSRPVFPGSGGGSSQVRLAPCPSQGAHFSHLRSVCVSHFESEPMAAVHGQLLWLGFPGMSGVLSVREEPRFMTTAELLGFQPERREL